MANEKISQIFKNISNLLQIRGENSYRQRSYEHAANLIEEIQQSIRQLAIEENLRTIPGIGQAIESKILEILEILEIPENWENAEDARNIRNTWDTSNENDKNSEIMGLYV